MKKIYTVLFALITAASVKAASYTITITGAPAYSPNTLTVNIGDVVTIQASATHPLNQVDATTWNANGSTTLTGGWGSVTSDKTFTASTVGIIYYVCQNHVGMGMKGQVTVVNASGMSEYAFSNASFQAYPNPASDKIIIKSDALKENPHFTLYNSIGMAVSGTVIREYRNNEMEVVLPENISSGIYFAVLSKNDAKLVRKIVVTK